MTPIDYDSVKKRAANLSLGYNIAVTAAKVVAAVLTGSVSLLSESVHSATDVVSSSIAVISVRAAALPPDKEHPYGHGKIETLAGFGESILLLQIVVYILYEASQHLQKNESVQNVGIGVWVMLGSSLGSFAVGQYVRHIGRKSNSLSLETHGQHLMIDFWTSTGVLLALVLTHFTGWHWIDASFAVVLAVGIGRSAWRMTCAAYQQLIDHTLPEEELTAVRQILTDEPGVLSYHKLRARHSGHLHYVEVHVVVPTDWSALQAHAIADRIEKQINLALVPAQTVVHVDPYDEKKDSNRDQPRLSFSEDI